MAFNGAVTDVAWKDIICTIPPKSKFVKNLFTRSTTVASTDIKTYDLGNFYIATNGQANTNAVGELYVRYRCRLISPELSTSSGFAGAGVEITSAAPTTAALFAGGSFTGSTGFATFAANVITFPSIVHVLVNLITAATVVAGQSLTAGGGSFTDNLTIINAGTTIGMSSAIGSVSSITFAATLTAGTATNTYIAVLPAGPTLSDESKLFESFLSKIKKMPSHQKKHLLALEDSSSSDEEGTSSPIKYEGNRVLVSNDEIDFKSPSKPIKLVMFPDDRDSVPVVTKVKRLSAEVKRV